MRKEFEGMTIGELFEKYPNIVDLDENLKFRSSEWYSAEEMQNIINDTKATKMGQFNVYGDKELGAIVAYRSDAVITFKNGEPIGFFMCYEVTNPIFIKDRGILVLAGHDSVYIYFFDKNELVSVHIR